MEKTKIAKNIFNIFLIMILIMLWAGILFLTSCLWVFSDLFRTLNYGLLTYIFAVIYALAIILPIVFRKRITKYLSLPITYLISTIIAVITVGVIFVGSVLYISEFSQQKWDNNSLLRIHMIDDLEQEHKIIGKTEQEIIDLLGEPACIYDTNQIIYEYYVGDSGSDPYGYKIKFENNIVKSTVVVEH